MSETTKYTIYGALFGLCFPIGSVIFLYAAGGLPPAVGLGAILRNAHANPLLYVIDSAPFFLGLFARLAGVRQDRIRRFSDALEVEVAEKTESLQRALDQAERANQMIAHMADHDPLTGLFNRRRFQQELERFASYALRYRHEMTLMFIDLDRFKEINDRYGHAAGDHYLTAVTETLRKSLRTTDYVARWGGDEFAVLLPETSSAGAEEVANKLIRALDATRVRVGTRDWAVSCSIGIALLPMHATKAGNLMAYADAAMYDAKQAGGACWRLYSASPKQVRHAQEMVRWEGRLRRALETDQFVLLYQPLLDLRTGQTSYYEALVRMEDRDGRLILPSLFLETAQNCGLSVAIDQMVIRKAVRRLADVPPQESAVRISVNIARGTLAEPGLGDFVRATLTEVGVMPARLGLEIVETAAMENLALIRELGAPAEGSGYSLILDDFGLGFSSFQSLQQFPVKMIKLDATLTRDLQSDPKDRRLIETLTAGAHDLGIAVTAKFVEDPALLATLRQLGVDYAQGFAVGRPIESIDPAVALARHA